MEDAPIKVVPLSKTGKVVIGRPGHGCDHHLGCVPQCGGEADLTAGELDEGGNCRVEWYSDRPVKTQTRLYRAEDSRFARQLQDFGLLEGAHEIEPLGVLLPGDCPDLDTLDGIVSFVWRTGWLGGKPVKKAFALAGIRKDAHWQTGLLRLGFIMTDMEERGDLAAPLPERARAQFQDGEGVAVFVYGISDTSGRRIYGVLETRGGGTSYEEFFAGLYADAEALSQDYFADQRFFGWFPSRGVLPEDDWSCRHDF
jgi:hypothetical protein